MLRLIENSLDMPLVDIVAYMQNRILFSTFYKGIRCLKNPLDLWVYQEIIYSRKPDTIVEIGNFHGGSTLALADYLDVLGFGKVIAVDIDHEQLDLRVKQHPRIILVTGDAKTVAPKVAELLEGAVMVIEDSAHFARQTLGVLQEYGKFVSVNQYMICEDTNCEHVLFDTGVKPGPWEALDVYLNETGDAWHSDRNKESFLLTWHPRGFLLKRKEL